MFCAGEFEIQGEVHQRRDLHVDWATETQCDQGGYQADQRILFVYLPAAHCRQVDPGLRERCFVHSGQGYQR